MFEFTKRAMSAVVACLLVASLGITPAAALTDADIATLQAEFDAAMAGRDASYTGTAASEAPPIVPAQNQPAQTVNAAAGWNYNEAQIAFELQNKERVSAGLDPLEWSDDLYRLACARTKELTVLCGHERPGDNCPLWESQPYGLGWTAENIQAGDKCGAKSAISCWMNSEGHKAAILEKRYQSGAIACYVDNNNCVYWSSLFNMNSSPKINSKIVIQNTDGTTTELPNDTVLFAGPTTK